MNAARSARRTPWLAAFLLGAALVAPLAPLFAAAAPKGDPVPAAALEHPPSALLAAVPVLDGIANVADCELTDLRRLIDHESDAAKARLEADYGPASSAPAGAAPGATMPARKRVLDQAATLTGDCLDALDIDATMRRTVDPELEAMRTDLEKVSEDFRTGLGLCPPAPEGGGKNPTCTRSLYARANVRGFGHVNLHLKTAGVEFAEGVRRATACLEKRERLIKDAQAAGIDGTDVPTTLAPLARAWAVPPLVAERYVTICRSVQEAIETYIPRPQ